MIIITRFGTLNQKLLRHSRGDFLFFFLQGLRTRILGVGEDEKDCRDDGESRDTESDVERLRKFPMIQLIPE